MARKHAGQSNAVAAASAPVVHTGNPADGQKLSALVDELFGIEDGSMTPAQADRVDQIVAELSELDRSAVPWIRERLESDLSQNLRGPLDGVNRYQRERVLCEVIGRIGGSEAFGLLADLLMREVSFWEYETVRLGAARGLGYLGDKRAIPLLQQRQQRGATTPYVMQAYEEALQALAA